MKFKANDVVLLCLDNTTEERVDIALVKGRYEGAANYDYVVYIESYGPECVGLACYEHELIKIGKL